VYIIGKCREGNVLGRDEGRVLGLQKGFQMGYELGFYAGCIHMWEQVDAASPESLFPSESTVLGGKVRRAMAALENSLREFPFENPRVRWFVVLCLVMLIVCWCMYRLAAIVIGAVYE